MTIYPWLRLAAVMPALLLLASPRGALARATAPVVAVVPLAAADTGVPYAPLPSPGELATMTAQVRLGLRRAGMKLVPQAAVDRATSSAGYAQAAPVRSCAVPECAARIGRAVHADDVVIGSVTREMAVVWGTDFTVVNAHTGKVVTEIDAGFKGDVQSMELGDVDAATCLARAMTGKSHCSPDRGW